MWKQEDKYKECCHNDGRESFDTCIECWDEFAERNPPMTNADRIRAMSDEELHDLLYNFDYDEWAVNWCTDEAAEKSGCDVYNGRIPDEVCKKCRMEWLRQPAED